MLVAENKLMLRLEGGRQPGAAGFNTTGSYLLLFLGHKVIITTERKSFISEAVDPTEVQQLPALHGNM